MPWRVVLLTLTLISLSGVSACWPFRSRPEPADPDLETIVVVDNRFRANVNVYLVRSGARTRLGKVNSQRKKTFQVPYTFMVGDFVDLRVVADAVGERSFVSERVRVWPGDEISLHVADRIQGSWITVRPS